MTLAMDESCDELLAGTALAGDEHGRRMARDLRRDLERLRHRGRLRDDLAVAPPGAAFLAQARPLAAQRLALLRLLKDEDELIRAERLRQVVVRTALHRLDGELGAAVRGHHDDHAGAAAAAILLEELEAAEPRHAEVAQHDVGLELERTREALLAVARRLHLVALLRQDGRHGLPQAWFVVDDQNGHVAITSACTAGSSTRKIAPPSAALSAWITPFMPSTSRAQTASPRPVPFPGSFVVTNGSNT